MFDYYLNISLTKNTNYINYHMKASSVHNTKNVIFHLLIHETLINNTA